MAAGLSTLETVRYWAGQKLLHSRFHPLYLKVTGKEPKPLTYDRFVAAEQPGPAVPLQADRYRFVLEPGVTVARDAAYWLMQEAESSGADRVYADEDQLDPTTGRRHSPVFRPGWSPELARHCDYVGSYLQRIGSEGGTYSRAARVLFHRSAPREYHCAFPPPAAPPELRVSAVICSRSPDLLSGCLQGLRERTKGRLELVPVLHIGQGQDEGLRQAATRYGAEQTIEYSDPFHFGRMCNLAAGRATGDFLLFLNDDVTPLESDWLQRMLAQAARPGTGAVGALLYFPDGRIQHAGVMIGTSNGAGHPGRLGHGAPSIWPWLTMTREVMAVTGACLLMPRPVFHELGGFDEAFPVNYNDVDLCLRAGKAGYRIIQECGARLEHAESATRKTGIRYGERRLFLDRWANLLAQGDPFFNPNLSDNELLLPDPEGHARRR
jgi:O-antigen biosynthesis protein